jgi:beta-mannosidase
MHTQLLTGEWTFRKIDEQEWLPAQVPGGVHTDLLAAGRIMDPFAADNEKQVQWIAESDWTYRRTFDVDPELLGEDRVYLVCDGLDTLAEVSLNGDQLAATDNAFRQYSWEIKSRLREGRNELSIVFRSPVRHVAAKHGERPLPGVSQAIVGGPYLRKAPCQFGWDWGPQLPPIGIWKEVRLEGYSAARLGDVHLRQHHGDEGVTIAATVTVDIWDDGVTQVALRVSGPDGRNWTERVPVHRGAQPIQVHIDRPQLWWPNGYGPVADETAPASSVGGVAEQPLYAVTVLVLRGDFALDQRHYQMGLRTLDLRREADEWGESFTFVVNGVPIFGKGANWIPADSFPTRFSDEQMEHLVRSAAETHQNMLRVWGGGFYESEGFYDLCDRYGILVWQDCVFSCSVYPLNDGAFLENVRAEVIDNVRRLRHRASLALWCGNNEMEWGWASWGWDVPELADEKSAYDRFFHHTLPEWCAAEDPDHPYWPSSPSSDRFFEDPNSEERGDAHYWDVWHGRKPFAAYRGQYPRFMSEFGFQSLPTLDTIRTYAGEDDWNLTSYIMEYHQRGNHGNGLIMAQMTDSFRLPKDFPSLVYLSMVLQAEGIRYGVEHWRRCMDRVSGTLYWQLNDCWPVASWSSIDYHGRWKALHYAARRFYAPVLLSIEETGTRIEVHLSSDLREPWQGTVRWSLETLDGSAIVSGEEDVCALPLASTRVRTLDLAARVSEDNCRDLIFVCELWREGRRVALSVATFVPVKHLSLGDPGLTVGVRQGGRGLVFDVTAQSLARFVELTLEGEDVVFSDNYFDVPAGRTVSVTCRTPEGWSVDRVPDALRVRSLRDSF